MLDKERHFAKKFFGIEEQPDIMLETIEPDEWLKCIRIYHNRMVIEHERLIEKVKKEMGAKL